MTPPKKHKDQDGKPDGRSSGDLGDQMAWMIEEALRRKELEVREDLGAEILRMGTKPNDNDLSYMSDELGENFEPSKDFLAGIAFAAKCFADKSFDY